MRRASFASVLALAAFVIAGFLATGLARADAASPPDHAERILAIVAAGQARLAELGALHGQTRDPAEALRIQQAIDLLKRTVELRILELQQLELERIGQEAALAELMPMLERCRAEVEERRLAYGLPLPVLVPEEE